MPITATEVGRLVTRLTGDGRDYFKMLDRARNETKKYTQDTAGRWRNAAGQFISAQKRMEAELDKTTTKLLKMQATLKGVANVLKKTGAAMRSFGRTMTFRVTAPLTLMGAAAIKTFGDFDKAMIESTAIMKVTEQQTERMRKTALNLSTGGQAIQTPKEMAESYFFLASAGKNAEQSMKLLPIVAQFATAGVFDMALATDLLTDAQSALGLSSKDVAEDMKNMTRVADVLVKANTLANASVEQFSIALTSKSGAALKAYNKDVEEGVAVLAALADQGVKAELAGNALDRLIRLATKGALDNAAAHKELGFRVFDTAGKMNNLGAIVANLEEVLHGMSDETRAATLGALGFEARVQGIILPLLGTSDAIKRYEAELRKAGGTTEKVATKQLTAFWNQLKIVRNLLIEMGTEIGERLAPVLMALASVLRGVTTAWGALPGFVKTTVVVMGLLLAVTGPVLIVFGHFVGTLAVTAASVAFLTTNVTFLTLAMKGLSVATIASNFAINKILVNILAFGPTLAILAKLKALAIAIGGGFTLAAAGVAAIIALPIAVIGGKQILDANKENNRQLKIGEDLDRRRLALLAKRKAEMKEVARLAALDKTRVTVGGASASNVAQGEAFKEAQAKKAFDEKQKFFKMQAKSGVELVASLKEEIKFFGLVGNAAKIARLNSAMGRDGQGLVAELTLMDKRLEKLKEEARIKKEMDDEIIRVGKERKRLAEDELKTIAKSAHDLIMANLSPIENLKMELEEIEALWKTGAVSFEDAQKRADMLVKDFADEGGSRETGGGPAIRAGTSAAFVATNFGRTKDRTEDGIWKQLEVTKSDHKTQKEILATLKKNNPVDGTETVSIPGG
jgi:TP901 family phage tail tape measure protein